MLHVKICGLTCLEDALAAVEAGADLLGFNFYPPSPRFLTPEACQRLVQDLRRALPEGERPALVGVFVNSSPGDVRDILARCELDLAQLAGDELPEALAAIGEQSFKSLRPATQKDLELAVSAYPPRRLAPAYLVDAHRPGVYGGTGLAADWGLAARLASQAPVLLAGGLHPGNVAAAVAQVRPWGVDVASGVESTPGRKDREKMRAFVRHARQASPPSPLPFS